MLYTRIVAEGKVGSIVLIGKLYLVTVIYVKLKCNLSIVCEQVSAGYWYSMCIREMYSVLCCSDNCAV